ncbi:MAG: hypothetical protein ACKPE6_11265 [Gammaproteobacteria bacterium]
MFAFPRRAAVQEHYRRIIERLRPPVGVDLCHVHFPDELRIGSEALGAHVVSRALCRFRYVSFDGVPAGSRLGYLGVQLQAWAPFAEAEFSVSLGEGGASVYAWDRQVFTERCALSGAKPVANRVYPEGFLLETAQDGVRLEHCVSGVEARVFRGGELLHSRWWPETPDAASWRNFLRASGIDPESAPATPQPRGDRVDWLAEPRGEPALYSTLLDVPRVRLHQALAVAALLLLVPTLWLGKSLLGSMARSEDLAETRRALEVDAGPLMRAREEALAGAATLEALRAQTEGKSPVSLVAGVSRLLPEDGTVLRELEWQGKQLRLVLAPGAKASRTTYVKALEDSGWLSGVHEVAGEQAAEAGGVVLVAELAGAGE